MGDWSDGEVVGVDCEAPPEFGLPPGQVVPYLVQLDGGPTAIVPFDTADCIRQEVPMVQSVFGMDLRADQLDQKPRVDNEFASDCEDWSGQAHLYAGKAPCPGLKAAIALRAGIHFKPTKGVSWSQILHIVGTVTEVLEPPDGRSGGLPHVAATPSTASMMHEPPPDGAVHGQRVRVRVAGIDSLLELCFHDDESSGSWVLATSNLPLLGQRVSLTGLSPLSGRADLNGTHGFVASFEPQKRCFVVELADGDFISVKEAHLEAVAPQSEFARILAMSYGLSLHDPYHTD